jgi:hypothetical protein
VTAVRPPVFPLPPTPAAPARADPTRSAAQKAFFDMAMGKAAAPAPTAPAAVTVSAARPSQTPVTLQRMPDAGAEKPQKILRPGSLLDIRV